MVCILGMGDCGVKQTSVTDVVSNAVSNVLMSNSSSCTAGGTFSQTLNVENIKAGGDITISGVSQNLTSTVNLNCVQKSGFTNQELTQIQNDIKQQIDQKTSNYQFQPSEQTVITTSTQNISNSTTMNNVATAIANQFASQAQIYKNLQGGGNITLSNLSQTAIATTTAVVVHDLLANNQDVKNMQQLLDSKTTQTATGTNLIACAGVSAVMLLIIAVIIALVLFS